MPKQAEYLHSWLRHLGIERAYVLAHDFGGVVVQHLLSKHPELCLGLVLSDSVAYDNWPVAAVRTARALSGIIEHLPPALVRPMFIAALRNLGHDDPYRAAEAASLHWQPYKQPLGPSAFAHQLRHFHAADTLAVAPMLPRLNVPARVVWGAQDPLGLASAQRLAKDLDAPLRLIPGAHHFTIEDHPQVIAEEFDLLLGELSAARAAQMTS